MIDSVTVNQSVEVALLTNGEPVAPSAPLIAGRPGLVRVHAQGVTGDLTATLTVSTANGQQVFEDGPRAVKDADAMDLDSTFHFVVPSELMTPSTRLAVAVRKAGSTTDAPVTLPAPGTLDAFADDTAPAFRLRFYPVLNNNLVPTISEAVVKRYQDRLYELYPVARVEVTVAPTYPWKLAIEPTGEGWNSLFVALEQERATEALDDDIYQVAMITPMATQDAFCAKGCFLGQGATATSATDPKLRMAIMALYGDPHEPDTLAEELGHAMGRNHAPCGDPPGVDAKFPQKDGSIGGVGWNPRTNELVGPASKTFDFMSHCTPIWTSAYSFSAVFERQKTIAKAMANHRSP